MSDLVEAYNAALLALFEHVGYVEDWKVIPVVDHTDDFWAVDPTEKRKFIYSPKREAIAAAIELRCLEGGDFAYPPEFGDCFYSAPIYTQRFLPRWVFRGTEFALVCIDTMTDGNKYLACVRIDHEVTTP